MRVVTALLGAALTLLLVADLINAMLVPRGGFSPIARMTRRMVTGSYRLATRVTSDYPRQHRILATAGPVAVLMQLIVYVASLILTMGMVVYGLSPLDGTTSLYQSGATLTTLGIVAPVTAASAIATFVAAFLGLVAIAVFIGYLLAIYAAYSARESLVSRWSLLAGEPAWAPAVFARASMLGRSPVDVLDAERWTDWMCELRTNTTVSPVLRWFRSPSPMRHWTTTMLSVLDTASLRLACGITASRDDDIILVTEGVVTARVLMGQRGDDNLCVEEEVLAALRKGGTSKAAEITEAEWEECFSILSSTGFVDRHLSAEAFRCFQALRSLYAPWVTQVAKQVHATPAPWSGPRAPGIAVMYPRMPASLDEEGRR